MHKRFLLFVLFVGILQKNSFSKKKFQKRELFFDFQKTNDLNKERTKHSGFCRKHLFEKKKIELLSEFQKTKELKEERTKLTLA